MNTQQPTTASTATVWSAPVEGLRLGVETHGGAVTLYLQNVGSAPLDVLSHVNAGERHFDWYTIRLVDQQAQTRTLTLQDDRDKAGTVRVHLDPGGSIAHEIDLVKWAARPVNGARPLAEAYQVYATYDVPRGANNWIGRLEAGPATLTALS